MKLYKEVLIKTTEQAKALPDGTVITREDHFVFQKHAGRFVSADPHDLPIGFAWEVVGWTALVPIEAEEETAPAPFSHRTRYVTPWAEGDA